VSDRSARITGLGAITSIGIGLDAYREGLLAGACGVGPVTGWDASEYRSKAAAEIREVVQTSAMRAAAEACGLPLQDRYGKAALFALAALAEALHDAGLHTSDLQDGRTGLVLGGSTAGMPEAEIALLHADPAADAREAVWAKVSPLVLLATTVASTADVVAAATGVRGPISTISTACSSATNAVGMGLRWIRSGRCDRVLVVGADAFCRLTHAGFNSLGVVDPERPRPFDARRQGMCIGEGAGVLVMEAPAKAAARGARSWGSVLGFGNVCEAHHPVQPQEDGAGAARAMQMALEDAGIPAESIDYVNAHGTATQQNDVMESRAIRTVFGSRAEGQLPVSSTKSQVGHVLGGSGTVELAACLLGLRHGFIPPTVGWAEADPDICIDPVPNEGREVAVGALLRNSFAFGGNDSSLCVVHPDRDAS